MGSAHLHETHMMTSRLTVANAPQQIQVLQPMPLDNYIATITQSKLTSQTVGFLNDVMRMTGQYLFIVLSLQDKTHDEKNPTIHNLTIFIAIYLWSFLNQNKAHLIPFQDVKYLQQCLKCFTRVRTGASSWFRELTGQISTSRQEKNDSSTGDSHRMSSERVCV